MKKIFFSTLCFVMFVVFGVMAQTKEANMSFKVVEHDFGMINEIDGTVSHNFEFINTGGKPLIITNVKASCGCTTPDWSKTPILPGAKGFVTATYNPLNRPGSFNKTITVTSNATQSPLTITIKGDVNPKPKTEQDEYPNSIGDLRLKSNRIGFVKIYSNESKTETMEVFNPTEKNLEIAFSKVPAHLTIKASPNVLKAGGKGKIEVTYNAALKREWDYVQDNVNVLLNGKSDPRFVLFISANIQEDFSNFTNEDIENAPKIELSETEFNFGTIKQGEKTSHKFTIKNNGKSDLTIRNLKASCGCTATELKTKVIQAGESTDLDVTFDSKGKKDEQNKSITITTNDPKKQRLVIWIKGKVEADGDKTQPDPID